MKSKQSIFGLLTKKVHILIGTYLLGTSDIKGIDKPRPKPTKNQITKLYLIVI